MIFNKHLKKKILFHFFICFNFILTNDVFANSPGVSCPGVFKNEIAIPHLVPREFGEKKEDWYKKCKEYILQFRFSSVEQFWVWRSSSKRPENFPKDPDFEFGPLWEQNGGILGFLDIRQTFENSGLYYNNRGLMRFRKKWKRLLKKNNGNVKETKKYIRDLLVKHEVTSHNAVKKMREIPALTELPSYRVLRAMFPQMIEQSKKLIAINKGQKPVINPHGWMEKRIEQVEGDELKAFEYIVKNLVKYNMTSKNFSEKIKENKALHGYPGYSSFQKYFPEILAEAHKRKLAARGKSLVRADLWMERQIALHGGKDKAFEYIVNNLVRYNMAQQNFSEKIKENEELHGYPSYSSFQKYFPEILAEAQKEHRLHRKKKPAPVILWMERQITLHGGEDKAFEHIVNNLVRYNMTSRNFSEKIKENEELHGYPRYRSFYRHFPEILAEAHKRAQVAQRRSPVRAGLWMERQITLHGGEDKAFEHIVNNLVRYDMTSQNFSEKIEENEELHGYPSYSSFHRHFPEILAEVRKRARVAYEKNSSSVILWMERQITLHKGEDKAFEHIVNNLVRYDMTSQNFSEKIEENEELHGYPKYSSFQKHFPDILVEAQKRKRALQRKGSVRAAVWMER